MKIRRNSSGQIAVIYALAMVTLVGVIGLCADVAVMYYNWQWMQKTADAAALAGANYLSVYTFSGTPATGCSGKPDAAQTAACTYAVKNGISASNVTISEPSSTTIKVLASANGQPYFFGRVLGLDTYNVSAVAVAKAAGPVGTVNSGLFPAGLQCNTPCNLSNLDPGQPTTFGLKFVGGLAPGNWDWLDTGGHGSSGLGHDIQYGASGSYSIGGTINTLPGNKGNSGPANSGMQARMNSCYSYSSDPCGGSNPQNIVKAGDPCLVIVPAGDFTGLKGKSVPLTIQAFAEIYIEPNSNAKTINGCFVSSAVPDTIATSGAPGTGPLQPPILIQ